MSFSKKPFRCSVMTRFVPSSLASGRRFPMTDLEMHQRGLLALLKNRFFAPDDPYLRHVADSRELARARKITLWWIAFTLEAQCRFTMRLLKRYSTSDVLVATYSTTTKLRPSLRS